MRLCVFAAYDKDGIIDEYIPFLLRGLKQIADYLIVVSNHVIREEFRKRLEAADRIYEREDQGFDAGAFADVLNHLFGWDRVYQYDELILANDSIFGPLYPLEEVFAKMDQRSELDFWGLVKRGASDFDGGEYVYPEHIQLYFYVIRRKMLHSPQFMQYWKSILSQISDFRSAVINYEFGFTEHFAKMGFRWDVCAKLENYNTADPKLNLSPYHYNSFGLIKDQRCPVIKRKLFTGDFVKSRYSDKSDLRRAFDYIDQNLDYNVDLIWSCILRIYPLRDIMESLKLYTILDDHYAYGPDIRDQYQILPVYRNNQSSMAGQAECTGLRTCKYTLVMACLDFGDGPESLKQARLNHVVENLAPNEGYIGNVIRHFTENPRLGVLIPPLQTFGPVSGSLGMTWDDPDMAAEFYDQLGLRVPFQTERAPVHRVDALWCRTELLNSICLEEGLASPEVMLELLPLIAQDQGFYTEILQNSANVKYAVFGQHSLLQSMWEWMGFQEAGNLDMEEIEDCVLEKRLVQYCQTHQNIYIYGAGQLACRVIQILAGKVPIMGVAVSDLNGNASSLHGYQVHCIRKLADSCGQAAFILTVGKKNNKKVEKQLKELGFSEWISI